MGDFPGHPFRGNQHTASGGVSKGDWDEPFAKAGEHTPEDAARIVARLERATGLKVSVHGSVGRGNTSKNDVDLHLEDPASADLEAAEAESRAEEARVWARVERGEITQQQAMEELFGDPGDKVADAMTQMGFKLIRSMGFSGAVVDRWHRKATGHTVELWAQSYGDGDGESGPRMWAVDYDPVTGEPGRRQFS